MPKTALWRPSADGQAEPGLRLLDPADPAFMVLASSIGLPDQGFLFSAPVPPAALPSACARLRGALRDRVPAPRAPELSPATGSAGPSVPGCRR